MQGCDAPRQGVPKPNEYEDHAFDAPKRRPFSSWITLLNDCYSNEKLMSTILTSLS